jgi:hypothetical protein
MNLRLRPAREDEAGKLTDWLFARNALGDTTMHS